MKKKEFMILAVLMLAVAFIPVIASADWSQQFHEYGVGPYDSMKAIMVTAGTDFQAPGISGFSDGSWSGILQTPKYIDASGTATTDMTFYLSFTNTNPFDFYFYAYNGTTNVENAIAHWDNGWSFQGGAPLPAAPVPIPAALWLLGTGLAGLVGVRRKMKI